MRTGVQLLGLILALGIQADAQRRGMDEGFLLRGQISSESPLGGALIVELVADGRSTPQSTSLSADGSFEFRTAQPGVYDLRIIAFDSRVVHHERVIVTGPSQILSITVPPPKGGNQSGGATVSIRQLQHIVPSQARKEFSKGRTAEKKGDHQMALEHFQKAVNVDPEFADAYHNLGTVHVSLGQFEQAIEQFQKVVSLVPDHTFAIANLSIVYSRLKRYGEAGEAARRALKLDPSQLTMRYILAVSLTRERGHEAEALDNLERAAAEIPKARLLAADILIHTGKRDDAANQLERYLRALPERDADRPVVEQRLAELRRP